MFKQCIAPDEIEEGDLVAYMEGAASPGVVKHIARCPACAAEVDVLCRVDTVLTMGLSYASAPLAAKIPAGAGLPVLAKPRPKPAVPARPKWLIWPDIVLKAEWRPVALVLGLVVIVVSSLTAVYYYQMRPAPAALEISQPAVDISQDGPAAGAIGEDSPPSLIVEPVNIVTGPLPAGLTEDQSAIAPPRNLLPGLKSVSQIQADYLAVDTPARQETYWSENQIIDPDHGDIYQVWVENTNRYSTLYYRRSFGDGQSTSDVVHVTRMIDQIFNPLLTFDAQRHLYVVWSSTYRGGIDLYLARSTDGGQTWSKRVQINQDIRRTANPSMAVDSGGALYVAWQNDKGPYTGIYLTRSADKGQTWSREARMAN